MEQVHMIGIDLAKNSFQLHGARADGSVAFRKKLSRAKLLDFVAAQPRCTVAMEACGGAHHWGREIGSLGHAVRLVPPIYVKAYVKRQKNDASDAEAICEASSRPTMRFVAVKTEEQQARGMLFRTRDLLVRQRTQTINALRGHLAEFGVIAPQGPAHVGRLCWRPNACTATTRRCRCWPRARPPPGGPGSMCATTRRSAVRTRRRRCSITRGTDPAITRSSICGATPGSSRLTPTPATTASMRPEDRRGQFAGIRHGIRRKTLHIAAPVGEMFNQNIIGLFVPYVKMDGSALLRALRWQFGRSAARQHSAVKR